VISIPLNDLHLWTVQRLWCKSPTRKEWENGDNCAQPSIYIGLRMSDQILQNHYHRGGVCNYGIRRSLNRWIKSKELVCNYLSLEGRGWSLWGGYGALGIWGRWEVWLWRTADQGPLADCGQNPVQCVRLDLVNATWKIWRSSTPLVRENLDFRCSPCLVQKSVKGAEEWLTRYDDCYDATRRTSCHRRQQSLWDGQWDRRTSFCFYLKYEVDKPSMKLWGHL